MLGLVPMRLQSSYVAAKAGRSEPDALHGARTRAARDPGQRHRAGLHGDRGLGASGSATQERGAGRACAADVAHSRSAGPATTQEIANGALFLAAPESSYITGHILPIDGGWTAGFARDF